MTAMNWLATGKVWIEHDACCYDNLQHDMFMPRRSYMQWSPLVIIAGSDSSKMIKTMLQVSNKLCLLRLEKLKLSRIF